jgi:hypothetical protein
MNTMSRLDAQIDDLYKGSLDEFVARRTTLAKSLSGAEARRVKGLHKPTVGPWAVNLLYWHSRPTYDRLVSTGEKLRAAQVDALKGRSADVRHATEAHRKALAAAVTESMRLASEAGARPGADDLTRMLEAVSLARELPEPIGRLTKPLRPAGFEALAGIPVKASIRLASPPEPKAPEAQTKRADADQRKKEEDRRKEDEKRKQKEDARRQQQIARATAVVARARKEEARTRAAWERSKQALTSAELGLTALKFRP